jgi:hypothetical protein
MSMTILWKAFGFPPGIALTGLPAVRRSPLGTRTPAANLSEQDYAGFLQWPDLTHWIVGERDGEPLAIEYIVDNGLVVAK